MKFEAQPLGKYIDIVSGYAFKSKDFVSSGIPIIKIKNITPPEVSLDDLSYIPVEIANSLPKFELNRGNVLIALTGSHINQMASVVGRVARVKYYTRSMLNQRVGKIVVNDETLCDLNYVYYYLSQEQVKISLARKAGGAANQANISPSDVKGLNIPFPSIEIQHHIADTLSAYYNLIENNQKQINLLEEAAMRLYKEWFVNLRFPGHENIPIVDGVPEGWNVVIVKDVSSLLRRGISPEYNDKGKSTVISQKCIRQFMVDLSNARLQDKDFSNEMKLSDGDVVICSTGTGTLGRVGQIFGDVGQCTFDSHVTLVRANKKIGKNYLGQALKMQQSYFENMGKGSTNQTELSKIVVETVPILIPNSDILNQFEDCVQAMRAKMTNCNRAINVLQQARDKLLPKLMSGEIEV